MILVLLECFVLFWHFLLSVSFFSYASLSSWQKVGIPLKQMIQMIRKSGYIYCANNSDNTQGLNHQCGEIKKEHKNMDYNYNAVYGFCAILTFLGLFIFLFTYFLCQFRNIWNSSQEDNSDNMQVLIHQCEEGSGKCYLVDQNVIKISCPTLIRQEVNKIFH